MIWVIFFLQKYLSFCIVSNINHRYNPIKVVSLNYLKKDNYEKHCKKRDQLKFYSEEIELTLCDPDVVTKGPQNDKRTYYRVVKQINNKHDIHVRVFKVPMFQNKILLVYL